MNSSADAKILVCDLALNDLKIFQKSSTSQKKYVDGVIVYYDGSIDNASELVATVDATVIKKAKKIGDRSAIYPYCKRTRNQMQIS